MDIGALEATAKQFLTGILSNPNYAFTNVKKAVDDAFIHAKEFLNKLAQEVDAAALEVDAAAKRVEAATADPSMDSAPAQTGLTASETEPK